jgi:transposase
LEDKVAWRIVTKQVKQNTYLYAKSTRRSQDEPGEEKYLGTADDIVAMVDAFNNPPAPAVVDKEFGAVAALWSIAQRLNLVALLDEVFPKRNHGPSIGTYLIVGAISRCLEPVSKKGTPEWYDKTILPRLLGYDAKSFSSQRFWDNCHELTEEQFFTAQKRLARQMAEEFDLYLGSMLYDTTNYDTYIATGNPAQLAERGYAKSKRTDLKVVGLAAMVTQDGHVPIFHQVYPGNRHDSVQFNQILPLLSEAAQEICHHYPDVTLVLDKGNNAKDTWEIWQDTPFHFVGSLPVSDYPDLLAIPKSSYEELAPEDPDFEGCLAYRTTQKVLGAEYDLVLTFNPELYAGQMQGITANIAKCQKQFDDLCAGLSRWQRGEVTRGRKPTVAGVKSRVAKIISRQYMKTLWRIKITTANSLPQLEVEFDQEAFQSLQTTSLGKSLVFTDRFDWSSDRIVQCYRSQWQIEEMFKWSKDRERNSWQPVYHWTDPMIRMHTFCCMLGLTLTSLLLRELRRNDFSLSQRSLFNHLEGIRETEITYPQFGRFPARIQTLLHELTGMQQGLYHELNLAKYRS